MKKLSYLIMLTVILGLVLTGCSLLSNVGQVPTTGQSGITYVTKGGPTESEAESFPLYAGQDWEVGEVLVWNDEEQLCVKYVLDPVIFADGWGLTETHLAVGASLDDIPTNKAGNPKVGNFPYGNDELGGVAEDGPYCIDFGEEEGELDVVCGDELFIAAHAVIEKTECELLMEAPYGAYTVTEYTQGLRKDTTAVLEDRSDPNAVLTWDTNKFEEDFFSLGFGGEIIVEFDCCIANGEGPDVLVVEDTWGTTYPLETAEVYASVDGNEWILLGEANNLTRDTTNTWQTVSEFDLGEVECAKYIKIVDTTDPDPMPANGDGYDLNTIQALHDCVQCTTYDETAWGAIDQGEEQFDGASWATYFIYVPECKCTEQLWQIGTSDGGSADPIDGSAEYPDNEEYTDEFTYYVGTDLDPINSPSMPGYIGSCNVCDIDPNRPCTDTTERLNIQFELYCTHEEGELALIYDRYGSETDTLYFDFDGDSFATVVATEGGFKQFNLPLPAAAAGTHTITIAYEGGGNANGHYIDYLKLVEAD